MLTEYETHKLQENVCRESDALAMRRLVRDMRSEPALGPGGLLKYVLCYFGRSGIDGGRDRPASGIGAE